MKYQCEFSPGELLLLATSVALIIAKDKNADELNVLGNLVVTIGSLLLVYAAVEQSAPTEKEEANAGNIEDP